MKEEKVISVLNHYQKTLTESGIVVCQIDPEQYDMRVGESITIQQALQHEAWMCEKGIQHVADGYMGKAFRWLGNIQGVLWINGLYTLNDLRDHSRPDASQ